MHRFVAPSVGRPRLTVLGAAFLTTLLLAGCTSSDGESSSGPGTDQSSTSDGSGGTDSTKEPAVPVGPACDDIWQAGKTLPANYTVCAAGSNDGPQDVTECVDGTQLIVFDDALWGVTGAEVVKPDVSPVQDTEAYGAAYAKCTGE